MRRWAGEGLRSRAVLGLAVHGTNVREVYNCNGSEWETLATQLQELAMLVSNDVQADESVSDGRERPSAPAIRFDAAAA